MKFLLVFYRESWRSCRVFPSRKRAQERLWQARALPRHVCSPWRMHATLERAALQQTVHAEGFAGAAEQDRRHDGHGVEQREPIAAEGSPPRALGAVLAAQSRRAAVADFTAKWARCDGCAASVTKGKLRREAEARGRRAPRRSYRSHDVRRRVVGTERETRARESAAATNNLLKWKSAPLCRMRRARNAKVEWTRREDRYRSHRKSRFIQGWTVAPILAQRTSLASPALRRGGTASRRSPRAFEKTGAARED
jgi:hypothetical protein